MSVSTLTVFAHFNQNKNLQFEYFKTECFEMIAQNVNTTTCLSKEDSLDDIFPMPMGEISLRKEVQIRPSKQV